MTAAPVTGIWLRGCENKIEVLAEVNGIWRVVIEEHVPLQDNDGNVLPISHIVEQFDIEKDVVRVDGRYVCVICGKQARDHPQSETFPWNTFVTLCDGREVKT